MILAIILQFVLTFVIELLVVFAFFKKNFFKILFYTFIINLFSWSLAMFLSSFNISIIILELGVIIVECLLIKFLFDLGYLKALKVSFFANLFSYVLGIAILGFIFS